MPVVSPKYHPPLFFRNGHLATIYSGIVRTVLGVEQHRERIILEDGDFLDLDWSKCDSPTQKLVVLLHGLEGDAQRPYMTGSAKLFSNNGFDTCSMNFRGCSGETNKLYRSYHSGATEDLVAVLDHILQAYNYTEIYLKGFSLGANLLLKYLGEGNLVPAAIKGAVAISAPCSLHSSCQQLLQSKNILYAKRFKKHLLAKLRQKQLLFPDRISKSDINNIRTLKDFDDVYTSKAHNFTDALDYYEQCSSLQFLSNIDRPCLIINAADDSFLGKECYPVGEAEKSDFLYLEVPKYGGHVGFWGKNNSTYTETRALDFFQGN